MSYKRSRDVFEAEHAQNDHAPYAVYGTALPQQDHQGRDDGSYVPIWKQEVTDERGRKRFHGAFTGGFSAGYFNTVGSKEGWTPSTFVSSRKDRAKQVERRPEDYMDEEDLREAEESKTLQTTDAFTGFGSTATDSTRTGGLMDIFRVSGETVGVKLLKRMGWKEGQGIGPKVRRRAKLESGKEEKDGETYLFAPENTTVVSFARKTDSKGLGFEGEARLEPSRGLLSSSRRDRSDDEDSDDYSGPKLTINGSKAGKAKQRPRGGIGVGILNDTGSDEEDPYSIGPRISYNRTIGPDKKSKKAKDSSEGPRLNRLANPLIDSKPVFISKKKALAENGKSGFRKCHDGRLPLEGFLLGLTLSDPNTSKRYLPPEIPKGWKSSKNPTATRDTSNYVSTTDAAKTSVHDPTSRAALLGETQLPGKSVFDYMTPESRERLVKATGRTDLPPALGENPPEGYEVSEAQKRRELWTLVPKIDRDVAAQALSRGTGGWMPYAEDENKRERYRTYLELQAGLKNNLPPRVPGTTTEEWVTELHEFARAAEIFKPMTGIMASRFTSSSTLHQVSESRDSPLIKRREEKPEDPAEAAAKVGMYGPMTRITLPFSPSRILCKRFNVKKPVSSQPDFGGSSAEMQAEAASRLELVSKETMAKLMMEPAQGMRRTFTPGTESSSEPRAPEPRNTVVDPEKNEALEAPRPGEEVFKAIFGSDDEDED
ncbi:hypothetical protein VTO42DRAFT_9007 [Malbranchea cinnamomea]